MCTELVLENFLQHCQWLREFCSLFLWGKYGITRSLVAIERFMQMRKQPCIRHLHKQLVCPPPPPTHRHTPHPNFAKPLYPICLGSYSLPKRNWRQCVCRISGGKRGALWEMCKWRISCYNSSILFPGFSGIYSSIGAHSGGRVDRERTLGAE